MLSDRWRSQAHVQSRLLCAVRIKQAPVMYAACICSACLHGVLVTATGVYLLPPVFLIALHVSCKKASCDMAGGRCCSQGSAGSGGAAGG